MDATDPHWCLSDKCARCRPTPAPDGWVRQFLRTITSEIDEILGQAAARKSRQQVVLDPEVRLVLEVIQHPAGFALDLLSGGALSILLTEAGTYEVQWWSNGMPQSQAFNKNQAQAAAAYFVQKRRELHGESHGQ